MRESTTETQPLRHSPLVWTGLLATTILTIGLGLLYSPVFQVVTDAARALS